MKTIQVGQFKAEFSEILHQVQQKGETYVIEYGKQHKKVAMLVPYIPEKTKRKFGQLKGQIHIPDNFDIEDPDINEMFYS